MCKFFNFLILIFTFFLIIMILIDFFNYSTYLSSQKSQCKFKKDGIACLGKAKLIRLVVRETHSFRWIIGCTNYKLGEQWHRYKEIDAKTHDIELLRKLFSGEAIVSILISFITLCYI